MSKTSLRCVLLGFLLILNVQSASAEQATDSDLATAGKTTGLKIGVVDVMSLIDKSSQMEQARKKIEKEFSPRQNKLNSERDDITKMEERLSKDADVMSEDEQKKLSKEVMKRVREYKTAEEELRQDFNQSRNEEMMKLQKSILEAIQALAKEEHFDLILHEGVVYANDAINVTAKVASRLESASPAKGSKK